MFAWWWGPDILTARPKVVGAARLKAENDVRTALVATLVGLAALGSLVFTALTVRINQQTLRLGQKSEAASREDQREIMRLQLDARAGEWYAHAVEQLASENSNIRIGALFALERVATLSTDIRQAVASLLCAYVWQHTHDKPVLAEGKLYGEPSRDVGIAMSILSRLPDSLQPFELSSSRLSGVILKHGARLARAEMAGVDLSGAFAPGADLSSAVLMQAHCRGATFDSVVAREADFSRADLSGAKFNKAILTGAKLPDAILTGAFLSSADLSSADLHRATMDAANLGESNLSGADLSEASLKAANLGGADLRGAVIKNTKISDTTYFGGTRLYRKDIREFRGLQNFDGALIDDDPGHSQ
jgi:uncharacterized protein YjbI with pentapeptide repeats